MFEYQNVLEKVIEACRAEDTLIAYEEEPEAHRFHVRDEVNFGGIRTFEVTPEYIHAYDRDGHFDTIMRPQDEFMGFICYGILDIDPNLGEE